jgi:hypothetical protein
MVQAAKDRMGKRGPNSSVTRSGRCIGLGPDRYWSCAFFAPSEDLYGPVMQPLRGLCHIRPFYLSMNEGLSQPACPKINALGCQHRAK